LDVLKLPDQKGAKKSEVNMIRNPNYKKTFLGWKVFFEEHSFCYDDGL